MSTKLFDDIDIDDLAGTLSIELGDYPIPGDTAEADVDGADLMVRVRLEHDPDTTLDDYDEMIYGRLAYIQNNYMPQRPDGFDGRARKLWTGGDVYWWQPPSDLEAEQLGALADVVTSILEYGFTGVWAEVYGTARDAYSREYQVEMATAYMGGFDPMDKYATSQDVLADLVGDALHQAMQLSEAA